MGIKTYYSARLALYHQYLLQMFSETRSQTPTYTEVSKGIVLLQTENIHPLHV